MLSFHVHREYERGRRQGSKHLTDENQGAYAEAMV